MRNADEGTVRRFGEEWSHFDQSDLPPHEQRQRFEEYFRVFPWEQLPSNAVGFDMGCGSGRWASEVAARVGHLHCIDASGSALVVARRSLTEFPNCEFHEASFGDIPLDDGSMDFGYSLGVLHHVPDTWSAMAECVRKLKVGAPFLAYMYYDFEFRPAWFRGAWKVSDVIRKRISHLPFRVRVTTTTILAGLVYWPLARGARTAERLRADVSHFPLSYYRDKSFYTMRTDALDRFGTSLEKRFSRSELETLMISSGLENIRFNDDEPYWCAVGFKAGQPSPALH